MPDILVVGAGFSGAVIARQLAENHQREVLLLEKRPHIAGNMFESTEPNGVRVHRYGPHIFHTNSEAVFSYLRRFSDFYPYEHKVLGRIDGRLVPIPFNYEALEALFSPAEAEKIKEALSHDYPGAAKLSVLDLLSSANRTIRQFGEYVYDRVFVHYTAKQWQQPIEEVDKSVINRVPVVPSYDGRYFHDKYQYMPASGYTALFERLLDHPGIRVELNCDAADHLHLDENNGKIYFDGAVWDKPLVYTGAPDVLLNNRYGPLPYRSLHLVFEQLPVAQFQPAAVVNYPNEEDFTRITEFKHMTRQQTGDQTVILKEYPTAYRPGGRIGGIPYYPIVNEQNRILYRKYAGALRPFSNLWLCGRLADYKYYNMDAAVARALQVSESIASSPR